MKFHIGALLVSATALLAACGEEGCTQEAATKKLADLTAKLQTLAATAPEKLAAAAPKMQEIGTKVTSGTDLDATCKAIDDMMVELSK